MEEKSLRITGADRTFLNKLNLEANMELNKIKELTYAWETLTWKVIDFQDIDRSKLQKLFQDTYELLDEYSLKELVPKEISGLLLEMHDFAWWVSDLDQTPLYSLYQEIVTIVNKLNKYFLTRDVNTDEMEKIINDIIK